MAHVRFSHPSLFSHQSLLGFHFSVAKHISFLSLETTISILVYHFSIATHLSLATSPSVWLPLFHFSYSRLSPYLASLLYTHTYLLANHLFTLLPFLYSHTYLFSHPSLLDYHFSTATHLSWVFSHPTFYFATIYLLPSIYLSHRKLQSKS